jgi:hypothetical protein
LLDQRIRASINDIYIVEAKGKVTQKSLILPKSVEIDVKVYNEGPPRAPDTITVVVNQNFFGSDTDTYKYSIKNNNTINKNEFWQVKFKFNVLDGATDYNVKLYIDENTKDEAEVLAA